MTRNGPLLAIAAGPTADPMASLAKAWRASQIDAQYFHYDEALSDELLLEAFAEREHELCLERECTSHSIILGGFSRGARLAAMLAKRQGAAGLLGLSYPFHKHGAPRNDTDWPCSWSASSLL